MEKKTLAELFFFAKNKVGLEIKKEKNQKQSNLKIISTEENKENEDPQDI
jgi:hypothetical protein